MAENTSPLILGIDLGGSKILTAVINPQGKILSRDLCVTPATEGQSAVIEAILGSSRRALEQADIATSDLQAVSIGAPGISNPRTGVILTSPHLPGWRDVPLRDIIGKALNKETFLINDANAAALGELHFGAARGTRNFIYITISTGIGGGIGIEGKLYTGSVGTAGEIGHMTIDTNGPMCNCGNRGCWEALASGTALAREARQRIIDGARTTIMDHAGNNMKQVTAEVVHQAAQQGDALARELIARTGYYVGVGLASLINIFNPELIVIGGVLSNMGNLLFETTYKTAEEQAFKAAYSAVRFATAQLGSDSGILGTAAYAFQQMNNG